ncbi:hypothetical protein SAMN05216252_101610 [Actinacidiphila glaucinigra]|uniref:DUF4352 domain-containing protein n=1 Tax=Actinacidiphila glaucinigra TaxID=235986 RepID=A0A238ZY36_9ACTN|nr:hypothetical protein SAMN05216252_101610 [Actinacidiphila glaucinigra]
MQAKVRFGGLVRRAAHRPLVTALAGALAGATVAALVAAATWPHPSPPATGQPLRQLEIPLDAPAVKAGNLEFRALALRCGIAVIVGTHAEHPAKGRLCRVRIGVTVDDSVSARLDNDLHRLVLADGSGHSMDWEAMQIKRQPLTIGIGAHDSAQYDLWFDIPRDAAVDHLAVTNDKGMPASDIPLPSLDWPDHSA